MDSLVSVVDLLRLLHGWMCFGADRGSVVVLPGALHAEVRGILVSARHAATASRWLRQAFGLPGRCRAYLQQRRLNARFVEAARSGDIAAVTEWLTRDPGIAERRVAQSALGWAIQGDCAEVVEALMDAGVRSWFGLELSHSLGCGAERTAKLLVRRKFDPNQRNMFGRTPLMQAARLGKLEIVHQMLRAGANPALRDSHGWTASDFAMGRGHEDVVAAIREWTER